MTPTNTDKKWFQACLKNKTLLAKIMNTNLVISDIDGALTDASVFYTGNASEVTKGFSVQDGFAIAKCNKPGMPHIAFISGRSDAAAGKRSLALNIPQELYVQGIDVDKATVIAQLQKKLKVTKEETIMYGDDVLDLNGSSATTLFVCPLNAPFYIQHHADLVIPRTGGHGAFRLLLDLILFVQKKHFAQKAIEGALLK